MTVNDSITETEAINFDEVIKRFTAWFGVSPTEAVEMVSDEIEFDFIFSRNVGETPILLNEKTEVDDQNYIGQLCYRDNQDNMVLLVNIFNRGNYPEFEFSSGWTSDKVLLVKVAETMFGWGAEFFDDDWLQVLNSWHWHPAIATLTNKLLSLKN